MPAAGRIRLGALCWQSFMLISCCTPYDAEQGAVARMKASMFNWRYRLFRAAGPKAGNGTSDAALIAGVPKRLPAWATGSAGPLFP